MWDFPRHPSSACKTGLHPSACKTGLRWLGSPSAVSSIPLHASPETDHVLVHHGRGFPTSTTAPHSGTSGFSSFGSQAATHRSILRVVGFAHAHKMAPEPWLMHRLTSHVHQVRARTEQYALLALMPTSNPLGDCRQLFLQQTALFTSSRALHAYAGAHLFDRCLTMPISGTTSATQNVPEDVDEMPSGKPGSRSIMISCCPACKTAQHSPQQASLKSRLLTAAGIPTVGAQQ